ncbi:PDE12 [Mytilus coruscus]|uniref:PDE12 n=1 Tax=Mytilus coruscus TaxID=42192 RepID=A0A6J8E4E1_MYTCO|nr:PDE12 [Mytilus coruscus]
MLKKLSKKKKRKKQETADSTEEPDLKIWVTVKEKLIENEATPINQTFVEGAVLHIEDQLLPVEINIPVITALVLPTNIMVGFPIYPKICGEFCDLQNSTFIWYRYKSVDDESQKKKKTKEVWDKVSEGFSYTPSVSDLGNKLKLTCMPRLGHRSGEEFSSMSKCDVEAGPGVCPFENRHLYTQNTLQDDGIRIVSYNILADIYADSDFSRNELFPYCPPYALAIDYRKQLLIKEITGYNSDLICLQEVDRKVFINDLLPAFESLGYSGVLQEKGGTTPEGEATFYRNSKFRHFPKDIITLCTVIVNSQYHEFWEWLVGKTIERLKASMLKKLSKKKKRKKQETADSTEEPDLKIWVTVKEKLIENEATPINQTFVEGAVLHIEDQLLPVEINVPVITALVLPTNIMVGFPIYPKIHVNSALQNSTLFGIVSDLGNKLKLTCMPRLGHRSGEEFSSMSKCDVEAGPGVCPFENRHLYTQNTLQDDGIRIVSYNILADIYADSDFSRNVLFPYCPPYALAIDYRKQLLIKEITGKYVTLYNY